METHKEEKDFLQFYFKKILKDFADNHQTFILTLEKEHLLEAVQALSSHQSFRYSQLLDVSAIDYLGKRSVRYDVVYHFLSLTYNKRLRLKVPIGEDETIHSLANLFNSAPWWEREVYDMFGIVFENHPDLRRILTDYNFEGHPLRKDFPVMGYVQVRYDPKQKKVIQEPLHLQQAYRTFDTLSPWKGVSEAIQKSQEKA